MATLSPNFLDELRARTPIAAVIGRSVRLSRSGREQKGCCPFHGEKTPSFYVYDDHFHCFGCGEHGDVISFVMKSTGASFPDAVEQLAREAGLEVPKASPQAAEADSRRASLIEVMEAAAAVYSELLYKPEGAAALSYLRKRGLTDATIEKFRLGWSGEGRGALAKTLARQGITTDQLVQAGLMKSGDFGPVDNYFGRVMFPIFDRRGKIISFGGRVIGDGQPKYINGPETVLFSKGRSLYGLNFARDAVRKGGIENSLLLVEGYMDVIGLAQAGFGAAVAPLGTALTEHQLAQLWRLSPVPLLCFDSDKAGRAAAMRTVELAYAHLAPDRSLKMVNLPDGQDPDSFIATKGRPAFEAAINAATPLSNILYGLLSQGADLKSAEGRAAFRKALKSAADKIADRELSSEVRKALFDRYFEPIKKSVDRSSYQRTPNERAFDPDMQRARILTSILVAFPQEMPILEDCLAHFIRPSPYDTVLDLVEKCLQENPKSDRAGLRAYLVSYDLGAVFDEILTYLPHFLVEGAFQSDILEHWWELFNLMPDPLGALRRQKNELMKLCLSTETTAPDVQADNWRRYTRMCQLVWQAEHVMNPEDV
jgi:DNA primase